MANTSKPFRNFYGAEEISQKELSRIRPQHKRAQTTRFFWFIFWETREKRWRAKRRRLFFSTHRWWKIQPSAHTHLYRVVVGWTSWIRTCCVATEMILLWSWSPLNTPNEDSTSPSHNQTLITRRCLTVKVILLLEKRQRWLSTNRSTCMIAVSVYIRWIFRNDINFFCSFQHRAFVFGHRQVLQACHVRRD